MNLPPRSRRLLGTLLVLLASPALRAAPGQVFPPLTETELVSIEAGLPEKATTAPGQPRRILIFFRTEGFVHASIPVGRQALQRLGEKTGAYTSVASDDMAMFDPEMLKTFDAVVFLNSTRLRFDNPAHRQALLDFVRSGKGVAGLHAATDNFPSWPEGQALMGGVFHGHPWNAKDLIAVKNDEPAHIVNAGFGGQGFWIREEIYQMRTPPYGRDRLRVLLSLDMSKPENARPAKDIKRTDNDFGISWIRTEGKGRVFYTSLGHNSDVFFAPSILRHVLDGLQFALGDLTADATPSAQLKPAPLPALAPESKTTVQELTAKPPAAPALAEESALRTILADATAADTALWAALDQVRLLGAAGLVPEVEKLATRPGFVDRVATVLGALRKSAAKDALLRLSKTVPEGARSPLLQALGAYPAPDVYKRLGELAAAANAADADAARETLASFGTKDAFAVLVALPASPEATRAIIDATSLIATRDREAAKIAVEQLQRILAEPALAPALRVEALASLATLDRKPALTAAEALLANPDRRVRQAAATLLASDPTPARVDALAKSWNELPADVHVAVLAASAGPASLPLVRLALAGDEPLAYEAGVRAAQRIEDLDALISLLPRLSEKGRPRELAQWALANSAAPELSARLRAAASQAVPPAPLPTLLGLLSDRFDRESLSLVITTCSLENDELRAAAFGALATLIAPGDLPAVLALAPQAKKSADRRDWRKALFKAAALHPSGAEATKLLIGRHDSADANERPVLIGALTLVRAPEATAALDKMLASPEAESRKAVLRALSAARGQESLELLVKVAAGSAPEDERILALRGAIETVPTLEGLNSSARITHFRKLWPLTFRQDEKDAILAAVGQIKDKSASKFIEEFAPAAAPAASAAKPASAPGFATTPNEPVSRADLSWAPHDPNRPKPPRVEPLPEETLRARSLPPADAILLFDGRGLDAWKNPGWTVTPAYFEIVPSTKGMLTTKEAFGSCRLHLEWWSPELPAEVRGQKRSNSGVFLMGRYEVQILESFDGTDAYADGQAGALYGQFPPLANALRPAGQWQHYDITFHRPVFDSEGKLVRPARMSVVVNGVKVQDNAELTGPTVWRKRPPYTAHPDRLPLSLQNHNDILRFRNIWLVPIKD